MNTHHDRMLAEPYAEDDGFSCDPEAAIEEMAHVPDCYDNWLSIRPLPWAVAHLLALLADGIPVEPEQRCAVDDALTAMQASFASWALRPDRFNAAPVDAWMREKVAV